MAPLPLGHGGVVRSGIAALCGAVILLAVPASADAAGKLSLRVSVKNGQVRVKANPDRIPVSFQVLVNKRRVTGLFPDPGPGRPAVAIGTDDGLRFGLNRIRVRVRFADGTRRTRSKRLRLSEAGPLVGAGATIRTEHGRKVRLRAKGSRAAKGNRVRLTWSIVRRPRGSKAKLRRRHARRPSLKPDQPGTYLVRLRARHRPAAKSEGSGAGAAAAGAVRSDLVAVEAEDAGLGPNGLLMSTEGPPSQINLLRIYHGAYQDFYAVPSNGSLTLFFDRQTLEMVMPPRSLGADANDAAALKAEINFIQVEKLDPLNHDLLVVITANPEDDAFQNFMAGLAGEKVPANESPGFPSTVVAAPRGKAGVFNPAEISAGSRTAGYIQHDVNGNFALVPADEVLFGEPVIRFDTRVPGAPADENIMQVGETTYDSDPITGGCAGGFHMLTLDPRDLTPQTPFGTTGQATFTTNCSGNGASGISDMSDAFEEISGGPPTLLLLQGIGQPRPGNLGTFANDWADVGTVLEGSFNGSLAAFTEPQGPLSIPGNSNPDNAYYAFAGENSLDSLPREVSQFEPNPSPVRLTGALDRDRLWRFRPVGAAGGTIAGSESEPGVLALYQAAYDIDTTNNPNFEPTPYPRAQEPQWRAALAYAAGPAVLGLSYDPASSCYRPANGASDVRSNYCGGAPAGFWNSASTILASTPYPGSGFGFSALTWAQLKTRLASQEFPRIERLNGAVREVQRVFGANEINAIVDLDAIAAFVQTKLEIQDAQRAEAAAVSGELLDLIGDVLWVAGPMSGSDDLEKLIGFIGGVSQLTGDSINDANGLSALGPPLPDTTVATFKLQLVENFELASASFGLLRDQIAADWHKLQVWDGAGVNPTSDDVLAAQSSFELGSQQFIYSYLFNVLYTPYCFPNSYAGQALVDPERSYRDVTQLSPTVEAIYYGLYRGDGLVFPPQGLMDPIFAPFQLSGGAPIVNTGGGQAQSPLGFYKPFFWSRSWAGYRTSQPYPNVGACS